MPDQTTSMPIVSKIPQDSSLAISATLQEWQFQYGVFPAPTVPLVVQFWSDVEWEVGTVGAGPFLPFEAGDVVNLSIPSGDSVFVRIRGLNNGTLNAVRVG